MPQYKRILEEYGRYRSTARPLVLATVVGTEGSTYRKAGAVMLLDEQGAVAGLLSGGCLEGDLLLHARAVLATGLPRLIEYDLRPEHELIWGPGTGCEGLSTILLEKLNPTNDYGPLAPIAAARASDATLTLATLLPDTSDGNNGTAGESFAAGCCWRIAGGDTGATRGLPDELAPSLREVLKAPPGDRAVFALNYRGREIRYFLRRIEPAPKLLILGAGPDAPPLVRLAREQGWRVELVDHRPHYLETADVPDGIKLTCCRPAELETQVDLAGSAAAVVMSHHFESDVEYLRRLLARGPRYVGLLGPVRRRDRLLQELGLREVPERLRAPIGLDLGGELPESIALAIMAEIIADWNGRSARSFRSKSEFERAPAP